MDFKDCMRKICEWFYCDTIEFLDAVLSDDAADPQYSAITALNRFELYRRYKDETNDKKNHEDIWSLLEKSGYTKQDVMILKQKAQEESKIYRGEILVQDFPCETGQ